VGTTPTEASATGADVGKSAARERRSASSAAMRRCSTADRIEFKGRHRELVLCRKASGFAFDLSKAGAQGGNAVGAVHRINSSPVSC